MDVLVLVIGQHHGSVQLDTEIKSPPLRRPASKAGHAIEQGIAGE